MQRAEAHDRGEQPPPARDHRGARARAVRGPAHPALVPPGQRGRDTRGRRAAPARPVRDRARGAGHDLRPQRQRAGADRAGHDAHRRPPEAAAGRADDARGEPGRAAVDAEKPRRPTSSARSSTTRSTRRSSRVPVANDVTLEQAVYVMEHRDRLPRGVGHPHRRAAVPERLPGRRPHRLPRADERQGPRRAPRRGLRAARHDRQDRHRVRSSSRSCGARRARTRSRSTTRAGP